MENLVTVIFSLSLLLNAALFIPQAIKIYRNKSSLGVSLLTFAGFNFIQFATVLHAYLSKDWILFWGYLLSFLTCASVTGLIIKYKD